MSRFGVRVSILSSDILKVRRNFLGAAQKLIRCAEKEGDKLTAAMLQEQAAFCYLFNSPPQYRKFGFRLVMAGHLFHQVNQYKHSLRCYGTIYSIYEFHNWNLIEDHIHFAMARTAYTMGNIDDAMKFIYRLLEKNYQVPAKQSSYLREFLQIYDKAIQDGIVRDPVLPIPIIENSSLSVTLRDYPPKSLNEELWKSMEKSLKNHGKPKKPVRFKFPKERKKPTPKIVVIGGTLRKFIANVKRNYCY